MSTPDAQRYPSKLCLIKSDSSTIIGKVDFVHSQYSCILTLQVSIKFLGPTKLLIIVKILEKKAYLTVK